MSMSPSARGTPTSTVPAQRFRVRAPARNGHRDPASPPCRSGFHAEQKRERVRDGLEAFATVASDDGGPTFAFIHLPSPHLPVVFAADGGAAPLPPSGDIHGGGPEDQLPAAAYQDQLEFLNGQVLDASTPRWLRAGRCERAGPDHHVGPWSGKAPAGLRERRKRRALRQPLRVSHSGRTEVFPERPLADQHVPASLQRLLRHKPR